MKVRRIGVIRAGIARFFLRRGIVVITIKWDFRRKDEKVT